MTLDEMFAVVLDAHKRLSNRCDRIDALADALVEHVERVTSERDYAVAVADSLRDHNARLERELGDAVRRLVDARSTFHAER